MKRADCPKLDPADIASLALDGIAADEYEIVADDLSRLVQAGGVAGLYQPTSRRRRADPPSQDGTAMVRGST